MIVPGGGPFADCVRREQKRIGFDDRSAHRMALLAMAAFGQMLARLSDSSQAGSERRCGQARVLDSGGIPVWLPLDLLDGRPEIPESWDMTSDSLAAWLAGRAWRHTADLPEAQGSSRVGRCGACRGGRGRPAGAALPCSCPDGGLDLRAAPDRNI